MKLIHKNTLLYLILGISWCSSLFASDESFSKEFIGYRNHAILMMRVAEMYDNNNEYHYYKGQVDAFNMALEIINYAEK